MESKWVYEKNMWVCDVLDSRRDAARAADPKRMGYGPADRRAARRRL